MDTTYATLCHLKVHSPLHTLEKKTFHIDGVTIHSRLFIPLNCKDLPSLSSK